METWLVPLTSVILFAAGILCAVVCMRLGFKMGRNTALGEAFEVMQPPTRKEAKGFEPLEDTVPEDVFDEAMADLEEEQRIPTVKP